MLLWVPGVLSRPPGGPPHIPVRWVDAIAAVWASISEGSLWPLRWVSPAAAHSAPLCGGSEGHVVLSARPSRSVVHFVVHQVGGWVGRRKKTPAPPLVEIRRLSIIGLILRVFVLILHRYLHFTPYHNCCQISGHKSYDKKIIIGYSYISSPVWAGNIRVTMIAGAGYFYPFSFRPDAAAPESIASGAAASVQSPSLETILQT